MRYAVVYLLSGKPAKYQQKKVKEIAEHFHENYLLNQKLPAHATLKYPFNAKTIKEVENAVEIAAKHSKRTKIRINRLICFHDRVICMKLDFSKSANKTYDSLAKNLKEVKWLEWSPEDKIKGKFHATLVYASTMKKFKTIRESLSSENISFDLAFDNIAILKKPGKYWKVHKIYRIK